MSNSDVSSRWDAIAQQQQQHGGAAAVPMGFAMDSFLQATRPSPIQGKEKEKEKSAVVTTPDYDELRQKYRNLKYQHNILDRATRNAVTERDDISRANKKLKFELAKERQSLDLCRQENVRLQELVVSVQGTMAEFAVQAKKDREEAVSDAIREYKKK